MEFDPKGVFSFRPDGKCRKNAFWTELDDVRQPGFLPCLEKPTQNGGMKPTSWNSIPRVFLRFAPMGKVEKRVLNAIGRRSSTRLFALLGKAYSKWSYETDLVEFDPRVFLRFAPMGKVEKTRFERNWTTFVNPAFCPAWKAHSKWWYETDLVEFDPKGVFSFRPYGECRINVFWTELDDVRQPGFFALLGKAHSKWWYETDLVEFDPNGVFRFAPMGNVEKTRFERNWTTFVNPAFCPAWKSPLKMVVWNRPRGIRSQGCFFVSPRWGKSKKRVLNPIGRRSWTRLFALIGKAHSKWWYETDFVEFDPKGVFSFRPEGESRKNAFWTQLDDVRQPGFLHCLVKPTQNGGMKPTSWNSIPRVFLRFTPIGKVEKTRLERNWTTFVNPAFCPAWKSPLKMVVWNRPRGIRSQGWFFRFAPMGKVEKTRFERNWTTFVNPAFCPAWKSPLKMVVWNRPRGIRSQWCFFVSPLWGMSKKRVLNGIGRRRQPGFLPCLEKPTQNGGMKPTSWNSIPRVFFRFAPMGKVEKTRFEPNWTTFVNPAFCPDWKSPLKMVVWNRLRGIRSQGCFFVSPRRGKSKKRVLNAIGRRSSTRLFALLGKAHSKWWYETDLVEFDPKGVFAFHPDRESRKNASWTQLDDVRQPGFLPCLEKPTQNGGMKPTSWNSIPRVVFRFAPMGKVEKTRFERNWTTFVNPAFCPAWKSPLKMVVWNRPRGIRSQWCFFVSPIWGMSKKRVLNEVGRRSSTRLFALLGKAHSKWWYETDLVEFDPKGVFSFRPDGESRKNAFWTQLDDVRQPGFLPCLEKPTQNGGMKPTSWNSIPMVFFRFAPMGKVEKTRFERNWTTFVKPAFCPAWKRPLKMVVWNRPRGIWSQGCFFVSPRLGKSKKRVLNAIGRRSSTRLFPLLGKAHSKWWYETDLVEFNPKGVVSFRPEGESRKKRVLNAIGGRSSTRLYALLGKAHSKWWY